MGVAAEVSAATPIPASYFVFDVPVKRTDTLLEASWQRGYWIGFIVLGPRRYSCVARGAVADRLHRRMPEGGTFHIRLRPTDPLRAACLSHELEVWGWTPDAV